MWLGEQITLRGVGNGISLIIFSGIVAEIPRALASTFELGRTGALSAVMIVGIFVLVIFTILMINKGIGRAVKYSGLGKLDTLFGFFFGFLRGYIICVCIFSTVNIFYSYNNWPLKTKSSWTFPYVQKGSNYLVKEFPNEKKYKDSKEKIKDI